MKIRVIGSTMVGYTLPKEEAIDFSGKAAGICYMPDTIDTLFSESLEKTRKRANGNIVSGHHSVFGHPTYNLVLEGVPKILAMILNNEKMYNTSEKSARYTVMEPSPQEKELYEKWIEIFSEQIQRVYPVFTPKQIRKLAMENARYLISVFTPATVMEYTVNFGQLNYIIAWARDYIAEDKVEDQFQKNVQEVLKQFLLALPDLEVEGLDSRLKKRKFSLFASRRRQEEFGENYSVNYKATFAQLAQAQRHRTLSYEMKMPNHPTYYIPQIIFNTKWVGEWLKDIWSLNDYYPQGRMVWVNERGTVENFVLKCTERLCGAAQLEIMNQTRRTLKRYLKCAKDKEIRNYLLPYSHGTRCTFPGWKCNSPCVFGAKGAFYRQV